MKSSFAIVNLEVAEPQRSKRLYIDAFGMTENLERSHAPGFVYLESERGHLTLATPQSAVAAEPSRTIELGFEVDDLSELAARIETCGVPAFVAQGMGWGSALEGHDLDGHRIVAYHF